MLKDMELVGAKEPTRISEDPSFTVTVARQLGS